MPSTYSDSLRFELIANGEQTGTWGNTSNRNLGQLVEQAIAGITTIDVTTGDVVMLAQNGSVDQARSAVLMLEGTPVDPLTITVPNVRKQYVVKNKTPVAITLKTLNGTGYSCPAKSTSDVIVNNVADGEVTGTSITDTLLAFLGAASAPAALTALGAAPLASPDFTGIPKVPTAAKGTNTTQAASTAFVMGAGVPARAIVFWPDATIPTGWAICDGTNGTPDLRNRTVIGANVWGVGTYGGSANSTLPSHSHGGATGTISADHSHAFTTNPAGEHTHAAATPVGGYLDGDDRAFAAAGSGATGSAGSHQHTGQTGGVSSNHTHAITAEGSSPVNTNYPPFYAGHWIMKL